MKKALLTIFVLLLLAALLVFAAEFTAAGFDFTKLGDAKYETVTYTADGTYGNIEIGSKEADIVFKPATDGKTSVVCVESVRVSHLVTVEEGTLKISVTDTRKWYDKLTFFYKPLSMTVYIPSGEYDTLKINTATGDVSLPGDFSFSVLSIIASTGNIECGASASKEMTLSASTGDISLKSLSAGEIRLSVTTGDITASSVVCEGTFSSGVVTGDAVFTDVTCKDVSSDGTTGSITLKNVIASGNVSVERKTGDIKLEGSDGGALTLKTTTGSITGTLRSDKVFTAVSTTGSVNVPQTKTGGRCDVTTTTGKIDIKVEK